uniref:Arrestin domain containing 4 n=1 Tax=Lepisosteus oculatus TaxID=7918 RepID=W5NAR7_LEPOC|nr:PREDICTED: arrestin domain-containing protein 4 [Lepisosteus oculatus]XP_015199259.1 PREDICTED: arrestin domain-containing protein 4 [Lepisosteus oculatus]XP_015199260.1 PREDICTED: arrestin domain-containing protein 4 [Lepisosteus oculatus]
MVVKVKALAIVFDSEDGSAYGSGEAVSGRVLLELSVPARIRALRVLGRGCARASWTDGPGSAPAAPSPGHGYREEVDYLNVTHTPPGATGEDVAEGFICLPSGKHEFPFSFQLPQGPLVTSFCGKHGSVQYWVSAILQRPSMQDLIVHREFPVISHVDVNSPTLLSPISTNTEKMVGCWFFTSGPIFLSAKIERQGYCNGEAIPIYAEIENCSSRLIVPKATIYQTQTCLANGKTKTFKQEVASVRGNHIGSGSTDTWNGKTLKIPPVTPSILNCSIIRVEYSLAVLVQIPGAKKLRVELPLVIGTIPYNGFGSRSSSLCSQFSMDMSWLTLALPEQPEAPPNYADVVSQEEFERHTPSNSEPDELEREIGRPVFAYIQEFRFQPPPLYSEIDPHPVQTDDHRGRVLFSV